MSSVMNFETIRADEIDKYINKEDILIIDLREEEFYAAGHITGAVNYPYDEFVQHIPDPEF